MKHTIITSSLKAGSDWLFLQPGFKCPFRDVTPGDHCTVMMSQFSFVAISDAVQDAVGLVERLADG